MENWDRLCDFPSVLASLYITILLWWCYASNLRSFFGRVIVREGLVIIAWGLSGNRGMTFGVDGLPLVGVVFFPSSSVVGVMLFPSYAE